MDISKLKRLVKYDKIPLILSHKKGEHIYTGLKYKLEITDTMTDEILPRDNELIKLKKVLNWEKINNIYKECFPSKRGRPTKKLRYKKDMVKTKVIKKARSISRVYHIAPRKTKILLKDTSSKLLAIAKEQVKKASFTADETVNSISGHVLIRYKKLNDTGKNILNQVGAKLKGEKISGRIASYYQDNLRTLPKGKLSKPCEFGVKLKLDMSSNGYITGYDIYKGNVYGISLLTGSAASHSRVFGKKSKSGIADGGFYNGELIEDLQKRYKMTLAIPHKKDRGRVMTPGQKKLSDKRSAIEAKISEGKRICGPGKSLYNGFTRDRIWTVLSAMALNIRKLLRDVEVSPEPIYRFG